jgi:hypothetical protein
MSNLIGMMINVRVKGEHAILGHQSNAYNIGRDGMSTLGGINPILLDN